MRAALSVCTVACARDGGASPAMRATSAASAGGRTAAASPVETLLSEESCAGAESFVRGAALVDALGEAVVEEDAADGGGEPGGEAASPPAAGELGYVDAEEAFALSCTG